MMVKKLLFYLIDTLDFYNIVIIIYYHKFFQHTPMFLKNYLLHRQIVEVKHKVIILF